MALLAFVSSHGYGVLYSNKWLILGDGMGLLLSFILQKK